MDPLSITVSVLTLVGVAGTSIKLAKSYVSGAKGAKSSIAILITELEGLQSNLSRLDKFLKSDVAKDLKFEQDSALRSCAASCEVSLKALNEKLGKLVDSRTGRYTWPLIESDHKKTVVEIRAFADCIQFAITIDGARLLSLTSTKVTEVLQKQLESFRMLQTLEDQTALLRRDIEDQTEILKDERKAKARKLILSWISKQDHAHRHHIVRSLRVAGTGGWLLDRDEYVQWRQSGAASNVLWCHGIEGSGKSVLTSKIIDELQSTFSTHRSPIAFHYFTYQDQNSQNPSAVFSSILRQIVAMMPEIPKSIADVYEKVHSAGGSLPLHEIEKLLLDISEEIDRVYIVIDALDECDEVKYRRSFLQFIDRLKQIQSVRLFVTSRQHYDDINTAFHIHPQILIEAHEFDLKEYMHEEIKSAGMVGTIDDEFAAEIVDTLSRRAMGMFLLPKFQLPPILKLTNIGEMEDALESLPRDLPQVFKATITRIRHLPESRSRLGMDTLMWICHMKRPMTALQLSEALSVKAGQKAKRPRYSPATKMMVECCQGLVVVDSETTRIGFVHYSIQEYLFGHSDELFDRAEARIAQTCMTYLLFDIFKEGPCADGEGMKLRIYSNPFLRYAATEWGVHVQRSETDPAVQALTQEFLGCDNARASANQTMQYTKGYRKYYWVPEECYSVTALHVASHYGLEDTVRVLLCQGKFHVDAKTKMGSTPLIKAASRGQVPVVRMLLHKGADLYVGNWYGSALHCAAEAGYTASIKELIQQGMNPNLCEHYNRPPIFCTADNDHAAALELLVELGADITTCNGHGLTVFHEAALHNSVNIVNLFLRNKWIDINSKDKKGKTATHYAAISNNTVILQNLLLAGANINVQDDEGATPLHMAVGYHCLDAVKLLLEQGASVNIRTHDGTWENIADDWIDCYQDSLEHFPDDEFDVYDDIAELLLRFGYQVKSRVGTENVSKTEKNPEKHSDLPVRLSTN